MGSFNQHCFQRVFLHVIVCYDHGFIYDKRLYHFEAIQLSFNCGGMQPCDRGYIPPFDDDN